MVRIYDAEFANDGSEHWHLAKFWWIDEHGRTGTWSRADAYSYVQAYPKTVYVAEGLNSVLVYGRHSPTTGTSWIQTYADGIWKDNLTALAVRHSQVLPNR